MRSPALIGSFGGGPAPCIDGEGRRHGLLVQGGPVIIKGVDVKNALNGIYVTGQNAVGSVIEGTFTACGTGLVAGGGGVLALVSDVVCQQSVRALGAGDGIQISEDAGAGPHVMRRVQCHGNAMSGVNFKVGSAHIESSTFTDNGECGVLAQVNAKHLVLEQSFVAYNNRTDNGTFNMGLEDQVAVVSRRNIYMDPMGGNLVCNNVNLSGASSLDCHSDQFLERSNLQNMGATLRLAGGQDAARLSLTNCSFYANRTGGIVVDAYAAVGASSLAIQNCAFWSRGVRILRYPIELTGRMRIDFNCYYREDDGVLVEVQDREFYRARDARILRQQRLTDRASIFADPMFSAPSAQTPDLGLHAHSPARRKGSAAEINANDYKGNVFSTPPNIGAIG